MGGEREEEGRGGRGRRMGGEREMEGKQNGWKSTQYT